MITWNDFIMFMKDASIALGVLSVFVEITPCKASPLAWLGKRINRDVRDELKLIDNRLTEIEKSQTKNKRGTIIDFANALKQGRKFSENAFQNVFKDIDDYHREIKILNIPNGYIEAESEYINRMYQEMSLNGTILDFEEELNEH